MIPVDILALQGSRIRLPSRGALAEETSELSLVGTSWHTPNGEEAMGQLGTLEARHICDGRLSSTDIRRPVPWDEL
jgi:hypothetical protein